MNLFRDPVDADIKRKEITWIAILCLVVLAAWQFLATFLGGATDFSPRSYEEKVLFGGLGAILLCSVFYIATREREQRLLNQRLLTNLRETMERLNERLRQLNSLCSASTDLVGASNADEICRITIESLSRQLKTQACILTFLHPEKGGLEYRFADSELKLSQVDDEIPLAVDVTPGHEISAPLIVDDVTVGTLTAVRTAQAPDFCSEEMSLLITSANMASKALEDARLHEELKRSYLSTLRTLIRMLGARDNYTATHAQRVSSLACRFAEHLKLSDDLTRVIEEFAPLHDLGKIGIPDHILLKFESLSPAERLACEQHSVIGEQILAPLRPDSRALQMVRSHHEAWDGTGYPDGLAEDEIPFVARLLHIVDSYDAILSDKPYSLAASMQEALAEIRIGSGRQFDPHLVKEFVAMLQDEFTQEEQDALLDPIACQAKD